MEGTFHPGERHGQNAVSAQSCLPPTAIPCTCGAKLVNNSRGRKHVGEKAAGCFGMEIRSELNS